MEGTFVHICRLLVSHGMVPSEEHDAEEEWNKYDLAQQRAIYRTIRDKIRAGKFVNYHPVQAIRDNVPKVPKAQTLSFKDYYARYGTTEERDGWKMENPTGNKVIYVKAG